MKPISKIIANDARYCMKYCNKNIEKIQKKDEQKMKFQREYAKCYNGKKFKEQR